ncbi:mitochondrial dna replication [Paramyrothecium foliicola]|nr:mitochondrial dna replication [Paramyrothecium foliicola]
MHQVQEYAVSAKAAPKKTIQWSNLLVGATMNMFQVTTLGQPMEVLKTHVAANRGDTLTEAMQKTWHRGGIRGLYQGLIPWAWFEASTKGAILVLTASEVEYYAKKYMLVSNSIAGVLGGIVGGASQAYLTMGMTTCMKTIEVTRAKSAVAGARVPGTMETFLGILRTKGIRGVNRGVNAVALRQITGWSSRIGISRLAEGPVRTLAGKNESDRLSLVEKICASAIGGTLSCWNQPFEVIRVEMQSLKADPSRPASPTMLSTLRHIVQTSGIRGLFRGIVPRIGVATWATICMIGDALVKLKMPFGGFLDGIRLYSAGADTRIIGPAVTVQMVETSDKTSPTPEQHFVDQNTAGGIMYIQQPKGIQAACWGGLMSTRAKFLKAEGVIVDGRIRDINEHNELRFPVFARGNSILGSNSFTRASQINVPLQFKGDLWINPGDLLVADIDGVVVTPLSLVDNVVALCAERAEMDEKMFSGLHAGEPMGSLIKKLRK